MPSSALHSVGPVLLPDALGKGVKVLVVDNSVMGGIATYTDRLVEGLRAAGADARLMAPEGRSQGAPSLPPVVWGDWVRNRARLYAIRLRETAAATPAFARGVLALRPDVVHLHTEVVPRLDPLALRLARARVPVVITAHDPVTFERGSKGLNRQAQRWRVADAVIIHGHEPIELVRRHAGGTPVFVVPVDLPLGGTSRIPRLEARARLGLPDVPTALLFGILRPYKGLAFLAETWPKVVAECPNAQLLVVGAAPEPYPELTRLERLPGVVVREGFVAESDIDTWAAAADVLVLPYLHGTHSGVLHRGLAMGTPVLASPYLAEEVEWTRAGRVVPLDVERWTDAMVDALGRRPLAAPEPPTGTATVARTLEVYETVMSRRATRR